MNRLCIKLCLGLALCLANFAQAQRPGGGGPGGAAGILMIEEVQKELSITDEQKAKLREAMTGQRASFQELQNLSAEERRAKVTEMTNKIEETVKGILDAKQQDRLGQLRIQREGGAALARAEVAEKLSLTAEQKEQIAKIQKDAAPAAGTTNFRDLPEAERTKLFTEMREKREKAAASLLAVLTADQKAAFEKLQGAKFDFPAQGRRPGSN